MSIEQEEQWITGEEFGRERRRLIEAGVPDDAPEFQALRRRKAARDEELFELYGKPYLDSHHGQWISISTDGQVLVKPTAGELIWAARETFGPANFASRRLSEFPGHDLGH